MSDLLQRARTARPELSWSGARPAELSPLAHDGLPREALRRLFAQAGGAPCVVVNDSARVIHHGLPALLQELRGWAPDLRVLIATGTHAGDLAGESSRLGGNVELHVCDEAEAHADLGGFGFDRRLLEASAVVAFGSVEPHYFAGWTGAHKTLSVGLWDRATTTRNHRGATEAGARPLDVSSDNPVAAGIRAGVEHLLAMGKPVLAINHVLDLDGAPLAVGWGDPYAALGAVTPVASRRCAHTVSAPFDVVLAQVEGPLGRSLYQADKGIKNHEAVVKDGGLLVLCAPLDEGVGPDRFVRFLEQAPTADAARERIATEGYTLGDHKALRWRALEARGVRIVVVSPQLDPASVEAASVLVVPTLEEALSAGLVASPGATGLAVEDAGFLASELV